MEELVTNGMGRADPEAARKMAAAEAVVRFLAARERCEAIREKVRLRQQAVLDDPEISRERCDSSTELAHAAVKLIGLGIPIDEAQLVAI